MSSPTKMPTNRAIDIIWLAVPMETCSVEAISSMFTLNMEVLKLIEKYANIKTGARNAKNIAVAKAARGAPTFICLVFRALKARNETTNAAGTATVAAAIAIEIEIKEPATGVEEGFGEAVGVDEDEGVGVDEVDGVGLELEDGAEVTVGEDEVVGEDGVGVIV